MLTEIGFPVTLGGSLDDLPEPARTRMEDAYLAACREVGTTYSRFMAALAKAGVDLDRKILADMAVNDPPAFKKLAELVPAAPAK